MVSEEPDEERVPQCWIGGLCSLTDAGSTNYSLVVCLPLSLPLPLAYQYQIYSSHIFGGYPPPLPSSRPTLSSLQQTISETIPIPSEILLVSLKVSIARSPFHAQT